MERACSDFYDGCGFRLPRRWYLGAFISSRSVPFLLENIPKHDLTSVKKVIAPFMILPLGDSDPEDAREYLAAYLTETEHHEPLSKKVMEFLGF